MEEDEEEKNKEKERIPRIKRENARKKVKH